MVRILSLFIFAAFASVLWAPPAEARAHVSVGIGLGCCGGYYPGYYPGYYYPGYYYAPSPLVYVSPPTPPTVVYVEPPPAAYVPPLVADQTSPTYTDSVGRTCRQFQSATGSGTACLHSDGSWRTVP